MRGRTRVQKADSGDVQTADEARPRRQESGGRYRRAPPRTDYSVKTNDDECMRQCAAVCRKRIVQYDSQYRVNFDVACEQRFCLYVCVLPRRSHGVCGCTHRPEPDQQEQRVAPERGWGPSDLRAQLAPLRARIAPQRAAFAASLVSARRTPRA